MNAERLLEVYEQISEAPDAIARLRRFVLDLAVRGKLVEQDAGDEPASELLKRIELEKARRIEAGEIKNRKVRARERTEPLVVNVPAGWSLTDLGTVSIKITDGAHKTPTYVDKGVPFVSVKDFSGGRLSLADTRYIPEAEHEVLFQRCDPRRGDILLGRIGTLGKAVLIDTDAEFSLFVSVGLIRFDHDSLVPEFFRLLLNSPFVEEEFDRIKVGGGTHTNKLNLGDLHTVALLIPPLAEQHRIVAKVDELMALCDRLEEARRTQEEVRGKLTAASLARLTAPDTTAEDFPTHAAFALEALPALTTRPDQIKTLRQTILNLAVRGKLVEQDPADEKSPRIEPRLPDSIVRPFEIPTSWQWARLRSLGVMKGGGTPSKSRGDFWNGQIPWVSPKDMKVDYITSAQLSITDDAISGSSVNLLPPESILFVVRGMILAHSFPVAISRVPLTINQDMKAIVLNDPRQSEYVLRALWGMKPEMLERVQRSSHGTCRIEGKDYSDFLIPLPSLAEQHRIVAKVDALMALCDRLEAALTTTDTTRTRLLEALLHEALEPATETKEAAE